MPFTQAQLEASLVALYDLMGTIVASGSMLESYTLPTGVTVKEGFTIKQMQDLIDMYTKLLRAYYPQMAISRGY